MKTQLNIRVTTEQRAWLKEQAPENMSAFISKLITKEMQTEFAKDSNKLDYLAEQIKKSILDDIANNLLDSLVDRAAAQAEEAVGARFEPYLRKFGWLYLSSGVWLYTWTYT